MRAAIWLTGNYRFLLRVNRILNTKRSLIGFECLGNYFNYVRAEKRVTYYNPSRTEPNQRLSCLSQGVQSQILGLALVVIHYVTSLPMALNPTCSLWSFVPHLSTRLFSPERQIPAFGHSFRDVFPDPESRVDSPASFPPCPKPLLPVTPCSYLSP